MNVKFVINDPKTGKSYQREVEQSKVSVLFGMRIGDEFDGGIIDLPGYRLKITGGSDKDGFPMKKGVEGTGRKRLLLSGGVGYRPREKGVRKRKTVRGEVIAEDIVQINCKIVKYGKQSLEELFGKAGGEGEAQSELAGAV